jgi:hypothetical protein
VTCPGTSGPAGASQVVGSETWWQMTRNNIPDGLQEISDEMPIIMKMIARTARWAHPGVFKSLPVWRPDTARNLPIYKADWITRAVNKGEAKSEETQLDPTNANETDDGTTLLSSVHSSVCFTLKI